MGHSEWVPPFEAMRMYGVTSRSTLRRWANQSKIEYTRTPNGRYKYLKHDINSTTRMTCIYARVSTSKQKQDLDRQIEYLKTKYTSTNVYSDIASSLNFKRREFNKLLTLICNQKVDKVICTHKDRIARFGFDLFEWICKFNGTVIIIDDLDATQISFENELVEDLLSVTHHFSGQMYAMRSHKKSILM
jgi:predicted site-specific integrase-resolvase